MKLSTTLALALALAPLTLAPLTLLAQTDHHDAANPPGPHAEPMKKPVPPSHQVTVNFQGKVTTFTVEDLLKMPQVTVHVHNAHRDNDETYAGPLLSDVLAAAGLTSSKETQPLILHSSIVATGTDKYFVLYSCAEVEPAFSNSKVIVAIMKSNGLPDTEGGNIQLVNTDGAKPARWIHGLTYLNVMSLAPTQTIQ